MTSLLIWFLLLLCHFRGSTAGLFFNEEREDNDYSFLASVLEKMYIQELNQKLYCIRSLLKPYEFEGDIWCANHNYPSTKKQVEYLLKASNRKEVNIEDLKQASIRNEVDIQDLKDKVLKAIDNLNRLEPRLDLMNDMISEQSKQIQQLEEALQIAKRRVSNIEEKLKTTKCPVMKPIESLLQEFHKMWKFVLNFCNSNQGHALKSYISEASDHVNKTYRAAKYQLQDVIDLLLQLEDGKKKLTVMGYDLTADKTVSALITCIMGLLFLFSILLVVL